MTVRSHRRKFIQNTVLAASSLAVGKELSVPFVGEENSNYRNTSPYSLMREVMRYRKIDAYANAYADEGIARKQMDFADRLGIEKLILSVPIAREMGRTPEEIRKYNDLVIRSVKRYPERLRGQFTLSPFFFKESVDEMKRCIEEGMVGLKLHNQFKINDPVVYPVIEQFIPYRMMIHVHGESQLGVGGHRMKYDVHNTPTISVPEDFAEVAKRYPEAMFQYAHIGGGGDWEYACKAFADYPNIFVDVGGSNNGGYMVDFAVETLGEDRVFFGTDSSYYQAVGNILSCDLTVRQKEKIFFENYNTILKKSGRGFSDDKNN
ncbi:MAG: amidohydrolase [Chitinophagaceae bacterium]|nr:amidohydrolase [Chitinophagaceae bacterium]